MQRNFPHKIYGNIEGKLSKNDCRFITDIVSMIQKKYDKDMIKE